MGCDWIKRHLSEKHETMYRTKHRAAPNQRGKSALQRRRPPAGLRWLFAIAALVLAGTALAETWRGVTVAPEHRCSPYDKKRDYPYPQSVEQEIVRELGAVYGPYTGTCFASTRDTDIEHIVAANEAHDSGLCAADCETRARFARDLRNLTLASPRVNRHQKSGKDAGEWLPARNRCWFVGRSRMGTASGCPRAPKILKMESLGERSISVQVAHGIHEQLLGACAAEKSARRS